MLAVDTAKTNTSSSGHAIIRTIPFTIRSIVTGYMTLSMRAGRSRAECHINARLCDSLHETMARSLDDLDEAAVERV